MRNPHKRGTRRRIAGVLPSSEPWARGTQGPRAQETPPPPPRFHAVTTGCNRTRRNATNPEGRGFDPTEPHVTPRVPCAWERVARDQAPCACTVPLCCCAARATQPDPTASPEAASNGSLTRHLTRAARCVTMAVSAGATAESARPPTDPGRNPATRATQEHDMSKTTEKTEQAVEPTEVDGTPKRSKSEQLRAYKAGYETYQAPNGNLSMDNGDEVALILRGSSPEAVMGAAEKLKGLEPGTLTTRYVDRNQGAKRMNSGNIIRGCVKRGDATVEQVRSAIKAASKTLNAAS